MALSPTPPPTPLAIHPLRPRQQPVGQPQGGQPQGGQPQGGQPAGQPQGGQPQGGQQAGQPQGGQPQGGQQAGQPQGGQPQGGQQSQASSNAQSQSSSGSQTSSSSAINIPQTAAAGGIQFTEPAQTAAASFYKIAPSQLITFGWNFTSLSITPTLLTVSAFCSDNGNTYPVGPTDGIIPGSATEVVWDAFSYDQAHPTQPLIVASYTLQIQDSHGLTQLPQPGRFAPNQQMKFALYRPQTYVPLQSYTCNGCSSAPRSASSHPVFCSLFITLIVMVLGGWGVLRRR